MNTYKKALSTLKDKKLYYTINLMGRRSKKASLIANLHEKWFGNEGKSWFALYTHWLSCCGFPFKQWKDKTLVYLVSLYQFFLLLSDLPSKFLKVYNFDLKNDRCTFLCQNCTCSGDRQNYATEWIRHATNWFDGHKKSPFWDTILYLRNTEVLWYKTNVN